LKKTKNKALAHQKPGKTGGGGKKKKRHGCI